MVIRFSMHDQSTIITFGYYKSGKVIIIWVLSCSKYRLNITINGGGIFFDQEYRVILL
jgi:hypothetical protein